MWDVSLDTAAYTLCLYHRTVWDIAYDVGAIYEQGAFVHNVSVYSALGGLVLGLVISPYAPELGLEIYGSMWESYIYTSSETYVSVPAARPRGPLINTFFFDDGGLQTVMKHTRGTSLWDSQVTEIQMQRTALELNPSTPDNEQIPSGAIFFLGAIAGVLLFHR